MLLLNKTNLQLDNVINLRYNPSDEVSPDD